MIRVSDDSTGTPEYTGICTQWTDWPSGLTPRLRPRLSLSGLSGTAPEHLIATVGPQGNLLLTLVFGGDTAAERDKADADNPLASNPDEPSPPLSSDRAKTPPPSPAALPPGDETPLSPPTRRRRSADMPSMSSRRDLGRAVAEPPEVAATAWRDGLAPVPAKPRPPAAELTSLPRDGLAPRRPPPLTSAADDA